MSKYSNSEMNIIVQTISFHGFTVAYLLDTVSLRKMLLLACFFNQLVLDHHCGNMIDCKALYVLDVDNTQVCR